MLGAHWPRSKKRRRVGILEKATQRDRGGNSALTGHMRFVFNGIEDLRPLVRTLPTTNCARCSKRLPHRTEAELWDEIMRVTNNQSDQDMLQVHVTESLKTVHWLARKGHDWVPAAHDAIDNILHHERRRLRPAAAQLRDAGKSRRRSFTTKPPRSN